MLGRLVSYDQMNHIAARAPEGSEGLFIFPFGNGAERVLGNKNIGATFHGLNLTVHNQSHVFRALQEGVVFAFKYGLEIMEKVGAKPTVIRAGKSNMFLSSLFTRTFADISGAGVELYNTDGAEGAARGAGIGAGYFKTSEAAFDGLKVLETIEPNVNSQIHEFYHNWKSVLIRLLEQNV
jgi:xylulokinase